MRLAKWVFLIAGGYGVLLVTPSYFLERILFFFFVAWARTPNAWAKVTG